MSPTGVFTQTQINYNKGLDIYYGFGNSSLRGDIYSYGRSYNLKNKYSVLIVKILSKESICIYFMILVSISLLICSPDIEILTRNLLVPGSYPADSIL